MGEHDQTVLTGGHPHVEDMRESIHDDGRTFSHLEIDSSNPGVSAAQEDQFHFHVTLYRYSHGTLIPDTLHVFMAGMPSTATKWESLYSAVFGTGTEDHFDLVNEGRFEPSFTPVIDDNYRIIGHMGWVDGYEICVPSYTVQRGSRFWQILAERRLGEERQWWLDRADRFEHALPAFGPHSAPKPPPRDPRWKPSPYDDARRGPFKDGSVELTHLNDLNYFLKGGGKALVGRKSAGDLLQREYEPYLLWQQAPPGEDLYNLLRDRKRLVSSGFRFLVLVSPDGHLKSVLQVEKVEQERVTTLGIALEVIDITLTVLMIIDIALLSVVLFRAGAVVARAAAIRAIKLVLDEGAEAALKAAEREVAKVVKVARALPGPLEDFPFASGRAPLPVPETPNKVYRIMSMDEAAQALKARKLPPHLPGKESARFVSLDSKYAMLFREKELADLSKLGVGIEKAEASLANLEKRLAAVKAAGGDTAELKAKADALRAAIDNRGLANRSTADPVIKEWYEAPGQKVVVEIELEPGALDDILGRSVETKVFQKYHGKDVYLWKLERGYGRNIGIPSWQIDAFNSRVRNIRFYGERGLELVGERKLPGGLN